MNLWGERYEKRLKINYIPVVVDPALAFAPLFLFFFFFFFFPSLEATDGASKYSIRTIGDK